MYPYKYSIKWKIIKLKYLFREFYVGALTMDYVELMSTNLQVYSR